MTRTRPRPLRLSIVIPTLNEQDHIAGLLDDLAAIRKLGHELILVDGGSRDDTVVIAAACVDCVVQTHAGRGHQMHLGARRASGDILWFLHADSRVPSGSLQQLLRAVASGGLWGRFDVRLSGSAGLLRVIERAMNLRSRITGVATGDQGIFVRRDVYEKIGGFADIPLMEDVALSKALRRLAAPRCVKRPRLQTSSRRWEQRGIVRTVLLMWRMRLAYQFGAAPATLAKRYR